MSEHPIELTFAATADERFITVYLNFKPDGVQLTGDPVIVLKSGLIVAIDDLLYLTRNTEDLALMQKFGNGMLKFPLHDKIDVIRNVIMPLQTKYEVLVSGALNFDTVSPEARPQLLLSEFEDKFLMLKPRFLYDETLIDYDDNLEYVQDSEDSLKIIKRDKKAEKSLYEYLRSLHPKFATQRNNLYYFLPFAEVMKGNWFLNMIQQVQAYSYFYSLWKRAFLLLCAAFLPDQAFKRDPFLCFGIYHQPDHQPKFALPVPARNFWI